MKRPRTEMSMRDYVFLTMFVVVNQIDKQVSKCAELPEVFKLGHGFHGSTYDYNSFLSVDVMEQYMNGRSITSILALDRLNVGFDYRLDETTGAITDVSLASLVGMSTFVGVSIETSILRELGIATFAHERLFRQQLNWTGMVHTPNERFCLLLKVYNCCLSIDVKMRQPFVAINGVYDYMIEMLKFVAENIDDVFDVLRKPVPYLQNIDLKVDVIPDVMDQGHEGDLPIVPHTFFLDRNLSETLAPNKYHFCATVGKVSIIIQYFYMVQISADPNDRELVDYADEDPHIHVLESGEHREISEEEAGELIVGETVLRKHTIHQAHLGKDFCVDLPDDFEVENMLIMRDCCAEWKVADLVTQFMEELETNDDHLLLPGFKVSEVYNGDEAVFGRFTWSSMFETSEDIAERKRIVNWNTRLGELLFYDRFVLGVVLMPVSEADAEMP